MVIQRSIIWFGFRWSRSTFTNKVRKAETRQLRSRENECRLRKRENLYTVLSSYHLKLATSYYRGKYMYFCGNNHHGKIRHSLRQNKNLDQNCVKIKNYGSAEIFTRPASFLAVLLYIYRVSKNCALWKTLIMVT